MITMNENRDGDERYFGFKLDQTSRLILFFLSFTILISYISIIYRHIVDLLSIDELIFFLIDFVLILIPLPILFYTLITCLKMRNVHFNDENKGVNWFGFEMNNISATILFFLSILGLILFLFGIYGTIYLFIIMWNFLKGFSDLSIIFKVLVPPILNLIGLIIMALIYIYTIQRCLSLKKRIKKEKEISSSEDRKKAKIFGFTLDKTSGLVIFIHALTAVISFITPIYVSISIFTYDTYPFGALLPTIVNFIYLLIIMGIYIYSLVSCVNLKKFHLNNRTKGIKWFGFDMNKTSACILYLGSILGLIGFLSTMLGFINSVKIYLNFIDNLSLTLEVLVIPIIGLIEGIILLLISIYTLRRCVKVRKVT